MLADSGNNIFFLENSFALRVIELQIAVDLTATFDKLLAESGGTTSAAIERRLKAIADSVDKIYRTDGIAYYGNALHIAIRFLMKRDCACRKDAPVDAISKTLLCR